MRAGALPQRDGDGRGSDADLARERHLEVVRQSVTTAATLAHERTLPVVESLRPLVPSGRVQRGSTVTFQGAGATSLALALVGEAVREGSFLAVVADDTFGLAACLDFAIPLRRVVQFTLPQPGASVGQGPTKVGRGGAGAPRDEGRGGSVGQGPTKVGRGGAGAPRDEGRGGSVGQGPTKVGRGGAGAPRDEGRGGSVGQGPTKVGRGGAGAPRDEGRGGSVGQGPTKVGRGGAGAPRDEGRGGSVGQGPTKVGRGGAGAPRDEGRGGSVGQGPTKVGSTTAQALAAIIEGFDLVLLIGTYPLGASQARQLLARNRERGSVLLRVGGQPWPDAADLRFDVAGPAWSGLGQGHGVLRARRVSVQVAGRRYHGRARSHALLLPAEDGGVEAVTVESLAATSSGTRSAGQSAEQPITVERFAGSDIDAMLDVVDRPVAAAAAGHAGDSGSDPAGGGNDCDRHGRPVDPPAADNSGLDAIA